MQATAGDPTRWRPTSWTDVLCPVAGTFRELLERFQDQQDYQAVREAAEQVLAAVTAIAEARVWGAAAASGQQQGDRSQRAAARKLGDDVGAMRR